MHRASLARAYLETKYKNLNQESQDREESQQKIQILNARMDQMGIAESERDKYRQPVWQEVCRSRTLCVVPAGLHSPEFGLPCAQCSEPHTTAGYYVVARCEK